MKELIVARGPAPIHLAVDYARQILAAIRFAHRHGIVHRDIKPHNVLVDGEGRLKVTDFGIARAGVSQMTEAGSIIGTAQYLSPEQARGAPVDQTLRSLLASASCSTSCSPVSVPFTGDTPVEIAMKHLSTVPEPPSSKRADIPRDLDLVVMRALAKDPSERYQSAEEMDADLAAHQPGRRDLSGHRGGSDGDHLETAALGRHRDHVAHAETAGSLRASFRLLRLRRAAAGVRSGRGSLRCCS